METQNILAVENLTVCYQGGKKTIQAVRDVSFNIAPGDSFALVGESGSGKSTIAYAILRVLPPAGFLAGGRIFLTGRDLTTMREKEMRKVRGSHITLVPQDPMTSLNPSQRIGEQVAEVFRLHEAMSRDEALEKAVEMLARVKLPEPAVIARKYPHEISGGQQQRVLIAIAFSANPDLLILDEPTTGLDVTTEARILDLIREMQESFKTAILFISHNLGVVKTLCRQIAVIYAGEIVEQGLVTEVFGKCAHPYTRGLLECIPHHTSSAHKTALHVIEGSLPDLTREQVGCMFAPRCPYVFDRCQKEHPRLLPVPSAPRLARCFVSEKVMVERDVDYSYQCTRNGAAALETRETQPLLRVSNAFKSFRTGRQIINAVDGISIEVDRGEILGIVGESGCGKTTLARMISGLIRIDRGYLSFDGSDVSAPVQRRDREIVRRIQFVFQNPEASLNPQKTVGKILARSLKLLKRASRGEIHSRIIALLETVKLDSRYVDRYPHELSGGECQRTAIARALAPDPDLLICDEALSSLDVSIQAGIVNLLAELREKKQISILFISHDLNVVRHISDRIFVLYNGKECETGTPDQLYWPPYHPYTETLLAALPVVHENVQKTRGIQKPACPSIPREVQGCVFEPECPRCLGELCATATPPRQSPSSGHVIHCHISLDELLSCEPVFQFTK